MKSRLVPCPSRALKLRAGSSARRHLVFISAAQTPKTEGKNPHFLGPYGRILVANTIGLKVHDQMFQVVQFCNGFWAKV